MNFCKHLGAGIFLSALLTMGCAANVTKHELYAAYGDDGKPTYYRINLEGEAYNGAVEYRAGWYDAIAVDELFGDVGSDSQMRSDMAKMQRAAVGATMKAYLDALVTSPENDAILTIKKKAFENALTAMGGVSPHGASATAMLDHAQKKFIIVLSLRPDEVITAVKGQVQKRQLLDAVNAVLSSRNESENEVLRVRLGELDKSIMAADSKLVGTPSREDLLEVLSKVSAEAEVLP